MGVIVRVKVEVCGCDCVGESGCVRGAALIDSMCVCAWVGVGVIVCV